LSKTLFEKIDTLGTQSPILVLKKNVIEPWDFGKTPPGLHLLVPLGDPTNLGALARSAEAFGITDLILLQEAASPFLPKALKASAGSLTRLKLWKGPSIHALPPSPIFTLDLTGQILNQVQWPERVLLLLGEEGAGVPEHPAWKKISIPTLKVESLNATVAASIALYDYSLKKAP
jgi:TrmH family RNA methyltransferase